METEYAVFETFNEDCMFDLFEEEESEEVTTEEEDRLTYLFEVRILNKIIKNWELHFINI